MDVYDEIRTERAAQGVRWGGPAHDDQRVEADWLDYIHGKVLAVPERFRSRGELRGTYPMRHGSDLARKVFHQSADVARSVYRLRLVQIAALAVAAIESLDRKAIDRKCAPAPPSPPPIPLTDRQWTVLGLLKTSTWKDAPIGTERAVYAAELVSLGLAEAVPFPGVAPAHDPSASARATFAVAWARDNPHRLTVAGTGRLAAGRGPEKDDA